MVLETTLRSGGGEATLTDCFTMRQGGRKDPHRQLLRVIEGTRGRIDLEVRVAPVFDYGDLRPWIRQLGVQRFGAIGGNDGLLIESDFPIDRSGTHEVGVRVAVRAGQRLHLSITSVPPEDLEHAPPDLPDPAEMDRRLDRTIRWWREWVSKARPTGEETEAILRSAMVLKTLTNAPTGAIAAAATTSLPEAPSGGRNWDYRYSWIRDSAFTVRSLAELGCHAEADGFRRFVERSAAGSAEDLQVLYGLGGERRLDELELTHLEGYRGAKPVRVGNAAARQAQLDVYGHLLLLAYRWHQRGASPDDDYWRFLAELVDAAAGRWRQPDRGIWESRDAPRHFVFSKVMCWAAMEMGLRLARECSRRAPVRAWTKARDECRRAIESRGYDRKRGVFVQAFGGREMDASLLLVPESEFVDFDDERMVRTVDAIREDLEVDGLLYRYRGSDGLTGHEGAFLACTFWLVECLVRQGRLEEAREVFDRAASTGNDVGLFSEEYDPKGRQMLGNFPQGLTHLSHIAAALALGAHHLPGVEAEALDGRGG